MDRRKRGITENGVPRQKLTEVLHVRIAPFHRWWLKRHFESQGEGVRELIERAVLEEAEKKGSVE